MELIFEDGALEAVADKAIERNIGARGLRAVMEGLLTPIMYEIPSDPTIVKVIITAACVRGEGEAELVRDAARADRHVRPDSDRRAGKTDRTTEKNVSAS